MVAQRQKERLPMNLDVVTFPALVVAEDGWVAKIGSKEDLSTWKRSAIAT
jgi:hypothetical protein